jgi:hypothetical protein
MSEQALTFLQVYAPRYVGAIAILIVGWLIALFLSRGVRVALDRTKLSTKVGGWFADSKTDDLAEVSTWISRGVFWLVMLFVVVAFFQVLGLTVVTEPISVFLNQVFEYAPRLIGPAVLVVAAWVCATILRFAVRRGLRATRLEERIESEAGLVAEDRIPLSNTLADTAYWLTLLLFLPAILGALNLGGLLEPVQSMIDKLLGFLPNLFAAAVIFLVGWLVARILRRIVTNVLIAVGADSLSERVGFGAALGTTPLSSLIGLIVYVLTLVPVLVAGLNALQLEAITGPASEMLNAILQAFPSIFAAILVVAIAYFVGRVVAGLTSNLLSAAGFDTILERLGIGVRPKEGDRAPSDVVGYLVIVAIMLFAAIESLRLLGFDALGELVSQFLMFAGDVILGLVIFAVGMYLANLAATTIRTAKIAQAELLALASRVAILVLAGAMGLQQMGVADNIITIGFGLVFGTIAVALAVAFGVGGRTIAAGLIQNWVSEIGLDSKRETKDPNETGE